MKRLALSLLLVLSLAPRAWAAVDVHDDVKMTVYHSFSNGGGPFKLDFYNDPRAVGGGGGEQNNANGWVYTQTPSAGNLLNTLFAFCVERTSSNFLSSGTVYDIKAFNTITETGAKYMSGYAAWVYDKFQTSGINPTDFTPGNVAKLEAYQQAIWAGMVTKDGFGDYNTIAGITSEWNIGIAALNAGDFVTAGITYASFLADGTWAGGSEQNKLSTLHGYQVINVQTNDAGVAQDQIIVPAGSLDVVPEPASLAVWSILAGGAAGLSVARRRRAAARGRWSNDNREAILSVIEGKHGH
jgi:hypothetical protein